MKLDKGLRRDDNHNEQVVGSWRDAYNVIIDSRNKSIISEKVFLKLFEGLTNEWIVGIIVTSNEFVLFITDSLDGDGDAIVKRYKDSVLTTILHTANSNIQFDIQFPISGEYYYNYKKELIVAWYSDCDIPRLLNIDDIPFELDASFEFNNSNDEVHTRWFSNFKIPNYELIDVQNSGGNLNSGVYYISIQYELPDKSYGEFLLISNPIFINQFSSKDDWWNIYAGEAGATTSKGFNMLIQNLDNRYIKFRVGIVYKNAGVITAYRGKTYSIENTSVISITTTFQYEEIPISDILVGNAYYNRIGASTVIDKSVYIN